MKVPGTAGDKTLQRQFPQMTKGFMAAVRGAKESTPCPTGKNGRRGCVCCGADRSRPSA